MQLWAQRYVIAVEVAYNVLESKFLVLIGDIAFN